MTDSMMYETGRGVVAVIPTYCEVESLPGLLTRIHQVLPELNILIVDDSSPDGTGEWVQERMKTDSRLHLYTRPAKSGLATAYVEGLGQALDMDFDFLIQMDADASHRPEDLPKLLVRMAGPDQPDMVIGSRWVPGGKRMVGHPGGLHCRVQATRISISGWELELKMQRRACVFTEPRGYVRLAFSRRSQRLVSVSKLK